MAIFSMCVPERSPRAMAGAKNSIEMPQSNPSTTCAASTARRKRLPDGATAVSGVSLELVTGEACTGNLLGQSRPLCVPVVHSTLEMISVAYKDRRQWLHHDHSEEHDHMSVSSAKAEARTTAATQARHLAVMLVVGAAIWLVLLVAGFFAPGGWTWGMAGPVGHIENYMISLWLVILVAAPLLAARAPLQRTAVIQVYLLGVLGVVMSTPRTQIGRAHV